MPHMPALTSMMHSGLFNYFPEPDTRGPEWWCFMTVVSDRLPVVIPVAAYAPSSKFSDSNDSIYCLERFYLLT